MRQWNKSPHQSLPSGDKSSTATIQGISNHYPEVQVFFIFQPYVSLSVALITRCSLPTYQGPLQERTK